MAHSSVAAEVILVRPGPPPAPARAWAALLRFITHKPLGAAGGFLVLVMVAAAILAEVVATHSPTAQDYVQKLLPPGGDHLLGTDNFGRDVYSRIIYGSRTSLAVGLFSSLVGTTCGALLGLLSGYRLGKFDLAVQRVMDIMQTFPLLILALVMVAALGASPTNVIIAISIPILPRACRLLRSSAIYLRQTTYVEAAKAMGAGDLRILLQHVMPNALAPYIVLVTAQLGAAILTEAALSFLGVGIPEPYPSWGRMLSGAAVEFAQLAPWLVIAPGVAISLAVFGFNLLGDALRDVLDPRLRTS